MFKPREVIIKKICYADDTIDICFGDKFHDDEEWFSINAEDVFKTRDWKKTLKKNSHIRIWTFTMTRIMGIEWWDPKMYQFEPVWVAGNDF